MIRGGSVGGRRRACCRLDRSPNTCTHCHFYMLAGRDRTCSALALWLSLSERAATPTARLRPPPYHSRSLIRASYLCHPLRHLIDLICFVAADAHLATLTTGSSSHPWTCWRDLSHTDSIRQFLSYFFWHELCLRRILILRKRLRSFSTWMSFINFSYILFKLMISWF